MSHTLQAPLRSKGNLNSSTKAGRAASRSFMLGEDVNTKYMEWSPLIFLKGGTCALGNGLALHSFVQPREAY
jgi:hypothetical protein